MKLAEVLSKDFAHHSWVNQVDADIKGMFKKAGFSMTKKPAFGLTTVSMGGSIRPLKKALAHVLTTKGALDMVLRQVAAKFKMLMAEGAGVSLNSGKQISKSSSIQEITDVLKDELTDSHQLDANTGELLSTEWYLFYRLRYPEHIKNQMNQQYADALKRLPSA